jgi:hypothetical protein
MNVKGTIGIAPKKNQQSGYQTDCKPVELTFTGDFRIRGDIISFITDVVVRL